MCTHVCVCTYVPVLLCVCELTMFNVTSLHLNSILGNFVVE